MAFFVAFYSYKGGVGRTLALANVAYALAARGKRVVLLDLDLEAPGLQDVPEFALKGSGAKKGFLDYAAAYRKAGKCPEITKYVHACRESPGLGKLWLMPAGSLGDSYQKQLGELAWRRLHPELGTAPFIEGLRSAIEELKPDYVLIDSRTGLSDIGGLSTHRLADMVVLVFNLTQSCIEGSVQTYHSFTSEGSKIRAVQLVASPVPPLAPGGDSVIERRLKQASEMMDKGPVIRVDYNPSMVLAEDLAVRKPDLFPAAAVRYESLREVVQRSNPEEVFPVLEQAYQLRSEGLLEEGVALLRSFTKSHFDNAEGYLALGNFLFEAGRADEAIRAFSRARDLAPDLALAHRRLGEALAVTEKAEEAIEALEKAKSLGDDSPDLFRALTQSYRRKPDPTKEIEARRQYMLAVLDSAFKPEIRPYSSVDLKDLQSEFIEVLSRRANSLGFQPQEFWNGVMSSLSMSRADKVELLQSVLSGNMHSREVATFLRGLQEEDASWIEMLGPDIKKIQQRLGENGIDPFDSNAVLAMRQGTPEDSALLGFVALDAGLTFQERVAILEEAIETNPKNSHLKETFGQVLLHHMREDQDFRRDLLEKAVELFAESAQSQPTRSSPYHRWGFTLFKLAEISKGAEAERLLRDAISKCQSASLLASNDYPVFATWGVALAKLAHFAPTEISHLLEESESKFQEALQIKPNHPPIYNSWAVALLLFAEVQSGQEIRDLAERAADLARRANEIVPGIGDYNLACALSRLGQFEEAIDLLKADLERNFKRSFHTLSDPDLRPLFEAYPDFKAEIEALAQHHGRGGGHISR